MSQSRATLPPRIIYPILLIFKNGPVHLLGYLYRGTNLALLTNYFLQRSLKDKLFTLFFVWPQACGAGGSNYQEQTPYFFIIFYEDYTALIVNTQHVLQNSVDNYIVGSGHLILELIGKKK